MERNSKEFIEQLVEHKFKEEIGEEDYKEYKWAEDILKKINKYGCCSSADCLDLYKAKDIAEILERKYCKKADAETTDSHTTIHYIWHTQEDGHVRASHSANDGKVFAWDSPPSTGNPGEDYGCRCWAEAYNDTKEEISQYVADKLPDNTPAWEWYDFSYHYFFGHGKLVGLHEMGHLQDVINCAQEKDQTVAGGGTIFERVANQIVSKAKQNGVGSFSDYFNRWYEFGDYVWALGEATITAEYTANASIKQDFLIIEADIDYTFTDMFTNPLSIGEGPKNQKAYDVPLSTPYPIAGKWTTHLIAVVKK